MASIGGIPVAHKASGFPAGAAFLLARKSNIAEVVTLQGGTVVEVNPACHHAVARFINANTAERTLELGHELVQQGLDILSMTQKDSLTIRDAADEHMLWWREGETQVFRAVSTLTLTFDVPPAKITGYDQHGNEIQTPVVIPSYHHAFRYYRLSQLTEDLFDAYRNMYLAFELLLSSKCPKTKEKEIDWLQRGLSIAEASLNLSAYLPAPTADPIQAIIKTIYQDARLPLFHAKHGRPYYPPQSSQHRQMVAEAFRLLTKIVLKMSEAWYGVRRANSGVYFRWVYDNTTQLLSTARMLVSDDSSEFDPDQGDFGHSRYESAAWMNSRVAPELRGPEGPVLLSTVETASLGAITHVRRFELVDADHPLLAHILEDELTLEGIDRLECQTNTRVNNVRQARSFFAR